MSHLILEKDILDQIFVMSDSFENIIDFIKRHLFGFDLICDYKSEDDLKKDFIENPLIEFIIENINSITYKVDLKNEILENKIFDELSEKNIFLIDINAVNINRLKKTKPYLFYNTEDLDKFDLFIENHRNTKILKVTKDTSIPNNLTFQNWNSLNFCFENTNSLIIFDNYLLTESNSCKLKDNFIKLIDEISNSKYYISVTIISEFNDFEDLNSKYKFISEYITFKKYKTNINLINHQKNFYPRNFEGFHSRFILTNYHYIISTDSLNYFKPNGKIINSADLIISCNIFTDNGILYNKEINSIKKYLEKIVNNNNNPSKTLKLMYKPTKTNPLIN